MARNMVATALSWGIDELWKVAGWSLDPSYPWFRTHVRWSRLSAAVWLVVVPLAVALLSGADWLRLAILALTGSYPGHHARWFVPP